MTPQYADAIADARTGFLAWGLWGRLGWRETRRRYRRTVFGPFWTTLSLGIFVVVLAFVWSTLWKIDVKAFLPFLASGMITWQLFSSLVLEGAGVFTTAEGLIKQMPISYTLLACAMVWRNAIVFGHNLLVYTLIVICTGSAISWSVFLVVPGLLLLCVNGLWIALVLALACARYRDIQQVINSFLQVLMFVTPIFWRPEQVTGKMAVILQFNLLYHYIELVRRPLLGQAPELWSWLIVSLTAVGGWALTLFLFARFRRRVPYWL